MFAVGKFRSKLDPGSSRSVPKILVIMALTTAFLLALAPIGNVRSSGLARIVALSPSSSGFDNTWSLNNCPGGSETIVGGVLQTRESSPGGDDNHYGFCSALRGSFPFGPHGDTLPTGITSVSVSLNFLDRTLLSGSRYHIFVGLYFHPSNGPTQGCNTTLDNLGCQTNSWFEVQSRAENIHGTDSQVGTRNTYTAGDTFGYDTVVAVLSPGQPYNFTIGVEDQFAKAAAAWNTDPTTPHVLSGIEIGTEGFRIQQVNVDWASVTLTSGPPPPPPPPPTLSSSFTYNPSSPTTGQQVTFTASASGGRAPYTYGWDFGDNSTGTGLTVTHAYGSPGSFIVTLKVTDNESPQQTANSQQSVTITSHPPPPLPPPLTGGSRFYLRFQGFDFDGAGEATITVNGRIAGIRPNVDIPTNAQVWRGFKLNITKSVGLGTNTVLFTHINNDCGVDDNLRNLAIVDQNGAVLFSESTVTTFNCSTSVTYTFTLS